MLLGVSLLVSLGIAETVSRMWESRINARLPKPFTQAVIDRMISKDDRLGHRSDVGLAGLDARGHRNATALDSAEIVVIGDSMTWGYNAEFGKEWPQVLGRAVSKSVYNLSLAGYGPVQYAELLKEGLKLKPQWVLVGLYAGNDYYDAYRTAWQLAAHEDKRDGSRVAELNIDGDTIHEQIADKSNEAVTFRPRNPSLWIGRFALIRLIKSQPWCATWEFIPDRIDTVLTSGYRLPMMDLDNLRVKEGVRITQAVMKMMRDQTGRVQARFLVVLIPTKEKVL